MHSSLLNVNSFICWVSIFPIFSQNPLEKRQVPACCFEKGSVQIPAMSQPGKRRIAPPVFKKLVANSNTFGVKRLRTYRFNTDIKSKVKIFEYLADPHVLSYASQPLQIHSERHVPCLVKPLGIY